MYTNSSSRKALRLHADTGAVGRGWATVIVLLMILSSCAARPGPETLIPVANPEAGAGQVTLLAVTNRTKSASVPPVVGIGRGAPSYEEFTLQNRASAQTDQDEFRHPSKDPSRDFVTVGRRLMDKARFEAEVAQMASSDDRTIAVFVHGYNYSYQEAVFRLAQLAADSDEASVPILFSWPSDGRTAGYLSDRDGAAYARDDLAALLTSLTGADPDRQIAVIGHSMGAWLVMETLRQLRLNGRDDVLGQLGVVLAAPDIDMDVFRKQVGVVGPMSTPLTLLVSPDDRILAVSGGLSGNRLRLGRASLNDPQLIELARQNRMRVMDISAAPGSDGLNHDRYVGFAARYAQLDRDQRQGDDLRRAGIYVLDTTGKILSAPFSAAANVLGGP